MNVMNADYRIVMKFHVVWLTVTKSIFYSYLPFYRFHFERCEFCQQPKTPVTEEGSQGQDALVPPSRRQRTSHIPIKPELVVPEFDNHALRPFSGVPYLMTSPLWNTLLDQEVSENIQ